MDIVRISTGTAQPDLTIYSWADQPWRQAAACIEAYPDEDFLSDLAAPFLIEEYCHRCPVALECGEYGLATQSVGVWGGVFVPPESQKGQQQARRTLREACARLQLLPDA